MFKEKNIKDIENDFREMRGSLLSSPFPFLYYFSKEFIREIKNELYLKNDFVKEAILKHGEKFYKEIYESE